MRLAEERGYDHVTVDDIADEADIAPRTFFRYFASKDDVFFTDHDEKLEWLREAIGARPTDEPILVSVREAVLAFADNFELDREQMLAKARLMQNTPSLRARNIERQSDWNDVVASAVAKRLRTDPETDLRPQVIASTTLAALQAGVRVWMANQGARNLREVAAEALDLLDGGI